MKDKPVTKQGRMNIAAIDIGSIHSAFAFWTNSQLDYFVLKSAQDIDDLANSLHELETKFADCSHIYIEQQMRTNFTAVKIENQMRMWFKIKFPSIQVISFSPKRKYQNLDREQYNTQFKRKKWAGIYAAQFIPPHLMDEYQKLKKKDDIADAIIIGQLSLLKNFKEINKR